MASKNIASGQLHLKQPTTPFQNVDKYGLDHLLLPDFQDKLPELFVDDNASCKLGILFFGPAVELCLPTQGLTTAQPSTAQKGIQWVSSTEELQAVLNENLRSNLSRLLLVHRWNSWSRLSITAKMFRHISALDNITPHFVKILSGFRRKWSSNDEDFTSSYSTFSSYTRKASVDDKDNNENPEHISSYDLCYNIRHFERHSRDLDDPWSCRQSAIHQKYYCSDERSTLLIISPPERYTKRLVESRGIYAVHPLDPHLQYLSAGIAGWREYLNYLSEQLGKLNKAVTITKPFSEYKVDFSSMQRIHNIRQKLEYAQSILVNILDSVAIIRVHEGIIKDHLSLPTNCRIEFIAELNNISNDLRNFKVTIKRQLKLSDNLRSIYNDILNFHKQELSYRNSVKLTEIAKADSIENQITASITEKTYQDSRTIRIMTMIALFYLPVNLVLSFFSTTLVWFEAYSETGGSSDHLFAMRVHSEIWVAVLMTLVLAVGTIAITALWERRVKRQDKNKRPDIF